MKHDIMPFNYNGHSLSTITDEHGEVWFVAKEVAEILEYSDASKMCDRLDADEKSNRQIRGLGSPTGGRGTIVINESGLYSAILGSTKPEARPFKKWVTSEVLPSIRKTGGYSAQKIPANAAPDYPAKLFPSFFKVARLIGCDRNAAAISANQAVMATTGANVLQLLGQTHLDNEEQALYFNVSDLIEGISGQRMNKMIAEAGLQERTGDHWTPTEQGMKHCRILDTGKKHGSGVPIQQIKWAKSILPLLSLGEAA